MGTVQCSCQRIKVKIEEMEDTLEELGIKKAKATSLCRHRIMVCIGDFESLGQGSIPCGGAK